MANQKLYTFEDLSSMKRTKLQSLCRKYGLKRNLKTQDMVDQIFKLQEKKPEDHLSTSTACEASKEPPVEMKKCSGSQKNRVDSITSDIDMKGSTSIPSPAKRRKSKRNKPSKKDSKAATDYTLQSWDEYLRDNVVNKSQSQLDSTHEEKEDISAHISPRREKTNAPVEDFNSSSESTQSMEAAASLNAKQLDGKADEAWRDSLSNELSSISASLDSPSVANPNAQECTKSPVVSPKRRRSKRKFAQKSSEMDNQDRINEATPTPSVKASVLEELHSRVESTKKKEFIFGKKPGTVYSKKSVRNSLSDKKKAVTGKVGLVRKPVKKNFRNIHQKHFDKMESIDAYLQKKQKKTPAKKPSSIPVRTELGAPKEVTVPAKSSAKTGNAAVVNATGELKRLPKPAVTSADTKSTSAKRALNPVVKRKNAAPSAPKPKSTVISNKRVKGRYSGCVFHLYIFPL